MNKLLFILLVILATLSFVMNTKGQAEMTEKQKQQDVSHLTDKQKYITLHGGTEKPFENEYWNEKRDGIYVDVINGRPLFSSTDKFDSGTGWPSFTRPIQDNFVSEHEDNKYGMTRTEVRSEETDAHLGHVFPDGPQEAGGMRYCINSAALKFIPKEKMAEEGYADYLVLFDEE